MNTSEVEIGAENHVLTVTFNRPDQRNAMPAAMYEALEQACDQADSDGDIRVMVLRGAGGRAFVAGTDISQFARFSTGQDGVDYERRVTAVLDRLQAVTIPTVASIDGYCVGGGLGIACAVDLRVATPRAKFGVPIARTLGNCVSVATLDLLVQNFGHSRTIALLLTAELMSAELEWSPRLDDQRRPLASRVARWCSSVVLGGSGSHGQIRPVLSHLTMSKFSLKIGFKSSMNRSAANLHRVRLWPVRVPAMRC